MKRRIFLFRIGIVLIVFTFLVNNSSAVYAFQDKRDFYEIRIYHLKNTQQAQRVEQYLKDAYIPALHRAGIKRIGVFKPVVDSVSEQLLYVLIPFTSMDQFEKLPAMLEKDNQHGLDGKDYVDAVYSDPPFSRIESILLKAFEGMPSVNAPKFATAASERVYELRSYEGHTEKIYRNKVQMFNKGDEIGLFNRLEFNAVFYGEVLVGSKMPNLMYMTSFENRASRDAHWKLFSADPEWKKLSAMPEYKNNVSKNTIVFLKPTDYSEL
ncbi:MAG: NIPSNAP family protein [Chitinophagaceae bacterium]|nr:NIPSNAP family protein [Chitinophagaceae bacterium]